jgi:hypothetical protein
MRRKDGNDVEKTVRRIWRNVEAYAFAMDYDEKDEIWSRIDRLERMVAEIDERTASKS